jgi:hypothetical protein
MSGLWLGVNGAVSTDTVWLFVIGLPVFAGRDLDGTKALRALG